ncbi:MAG: hypothetical protein KGN84_11510 [Acidobacteriota bacterium]|nr:hypothetical protein [Acidobacteriota bacterium]
MIVYIVLLVMGAWLCMTLPIVGYPVAFLLIVWLLFYNRTPRGEILDTQPPGDMHHRH